MRLSPQQAREILRRVDPSRVFRRRAFGLRDGALLALVAAGLSAVEIAALEARAITMTGGRVAVAVQRQGGPWTFVLPIDLGARLLAWLTERRLWAAESPVFTGRRGPLTPRGVTAVLARHRYKVPAKRK